MYFKSILIMSLKNLLVLQPIFSTAHRREEFQMLSCLLFLFHALFSQKVCLLNPIFIATYLCKNIFYLFFLYLRYGKVHLFPDARIVFLSSDMAHGKLNVKLFVAEQSWALRNFASGPTDRDWVTEMSKGPCYMEVSLTSPGCRRQRLIRCA